MNFDEIDLFNAVPSQTSYHACGLEHGSDKLGKLASKIDALGHLLTAPMSSCLSMYSRVFLLSFNPGYFMQKNNACSETLYRIALLTQAAVYSCIVLTPAIVGVLLRTSTYSFKRDFIWEGPKEALAEEKQTPLNDSLSLMTYNMAALPDFVTTRNHLSSTIDRVKQIPDALQKALEGEELPDFIFCQEVFHTEASKILSDKFKEKGYSSIIRNIGPQRIGLNSGLFLASKHRLSNITFYPHIYSGDFIERSANKGLLIATAHVGNKQIIIANTHLNGGAPEGGYLTRSIQIRSIMAHIDCYINNTFKQDLSIDGIFLSGDLNISLTTDDGQIDPEWYLNPVLLANPLVKAALPSKDNLTIRSAWKPYLQLVKAMQEAIKPTSVNLGGPLPPDVYTSDITSLETSLDGSLLDTSASKEGITPSKPARVDFNLVRTKKGFEERSLQTPYVINSKVIHLTKTLSDHYPVRTVFSWETPK